MINVGVMLDIYIYIYINAHVEQNIVLCTGVKCFQKKIIKFYKRTLENVLKFC